MKKNFIQPEDFMQDIMIDILGYEKKSCQCPHTSNRFSAIQPYFIVFTVINESLNRLELIVFGLVREANALFDRVKNIPSLRERKSNLARIFNA
jgi:hypothetical protein